MEYSFFNQSDERLLELADFPRENGIALAMRTTGYTPTEDEILEFVIVDLQGKELFSKRVKPQNIESWEPSEASGFIAPADVEDSPELYQFEEEVMELFEKADIVVFEHQAFEVALIESSWISLPPFTGFDLSEEFRLAHCTKDYPKESATAAALPDILEYYGVADAGGSAAMGGAADAMGKAEEASLASLVEKAAQIATCYDAFVAEHIRERDGKGQAYWDERDRRLAEEAAKNATVDATARMREHRLNQMNGLLWVSGAIIFVSLIIQLHQRGGEPSFMIMAGAVAVFCLIRAVANFRK